MALTLNSSPDALSNSGLYNITTSLVEDATHVNLRVRAEITVASVVVAIVEKPKGIADFDFWDILKANVLGITRAKGEGNTVFVSGGSPLVSYSVIFTEVWEDASGVTTTGATNSPAAKRFVPSKATNFVSYILYDDDAFACQTIRENVVKYYTAVPYEYWIVFFSNLVHMELFFSRDGGAWNHNIHFDLTEGWGVIVLDSGLNGLMLGVTDNLRIQLGEVGYSKISEILTIYVDNSVIDERVVLEYDGNFGGKEYLAFEGLKDQSFATERNYYKGAKKNRLPLSFTGVNRQRLETRFKDINNAEYLKSLMISDNVKKLEASYAAPTDVTVISDSVKTAASDLFVNQVDIEYEY